MTAHEAFFPRGMVKLARPAGTAGAGKERLIASKMAANVHQPHGLHRLAPPFVRLVAPAIGDHYRITITHQRRGCNVSPPQADAPAGRRDLTGLNATAIIGNRARHGSDITCLKSRMRPP
jgi:hypothetical protein